MIVAVLQLLETDTSIEQAKVPSPSNALTCEPDHEEQQQ